MNLRTSRCSHAAWYLGVSQGTCVNGLPSYGSLPGTPGVWLLEDRCQVRWRSLLDCYPAMKYTVSQQVQLGSPVAQALD